MKTNIKFIFLATCICGTIFLSWNLSNIKSSDRKIRRRQLGGSYLNLRHGKTIHTKVRKTEAEKRSIERYVKPMFKQSPQLEMPNRKNRDINVRKIEIEKPFIERNVKPVYKESPYMEMQNSKMRGINVRKIEAELPFNDLNVKSAFKQPQQLEKQNRKMRNINVHKTEVKKTLSKRNVNSMVQLKKRLTAFPPTLVNKTDINPAIMAFFTLGEDETRDRYINLHQYNFLLNTHICIERKLFLLIVVHSAPYNIKKRLTIRSTYGSVHSHRGRQLGVVFMLGSSYNQQLQESLNIESQMFGDIVQGDFYDSYRNLSRKHIMAIHWYVHHCSSEFILKVDDDTFVNPFLIIETLAGEQNDEMVLRCCVIQEGTPDRSRTSKWHTSVEQYPFPVFPPFCLGCAYITTPRVWEALYRASEDQRMMNMDDVFVSVVLSLKANIGKIALKGVMECRGKSRLVTKRHLLRYRSLILDRNNTCGDIPFKLWKVLEDNYT